MSVVEMYSFKCIQSTCVVGVNGALGPGEGVLEGVEKVPEDPGQDGVVE